MTSTLEHLSSQVGWPITKAILSKCTTFCFPDRLGNGKPFTHENFSYFPTLEELGIDDWDCRIVNSLIPVDHSLAVWALSSTWKMMKLSKWHREGRLVLAEGMQWENKYERWVFATIPKDSSLCRQYVLKFIGYDTELYPEFIFVLFNELETQDKKYLIQWSRKQEFWRYPCQVIPRYAESILAFHDGWIYLAVASNIELNIIRIIEKLALDWNISLIEGPCEWSWIPVAGTSRLGRM